jgi:hypothetical protein
MSILHWLGWSHPILLLYSPAPELEHVETAVPATAVGACVIVRVFVDVAFAHGEFPVAVKVSVTLPL